MIKKDDYVIVLDFLPHGYPLEGKMQPVVQAVGEQHLALLEIAPTRGATFSHGEKVYIGPEKRDKVYYIIGRLPAEKLTENAKIQLQEFIAKMVGEHEEKFVNFFNNSQAINTRLHQLELLPGFGKKHTKEILDARREKTFESFADIKERVSSVPDPKKAIEKRISEEILERPRQILFVN
jgi:putative nucleotide binding protein